MQDIPEDVIVISYCGYADGGSEMVLVIPTAIVSKEEMDELSRWNLRCPWEDKGVYKTDARIIAAYLAHRPAHPFMNGEECLARWPEIKELFPNEFDPARPPSSKYAKRVPWCALEEYMMNGKWSQFDTPRAGKPVLSEGQRAVQVFVLIKNLA